MAAVKHISNKRMDKRAHGKVGVLRPSSNLQPPPLFRSIGPPGLSASLPPHRRLRSIFCRSRAVVPANKHIIEASDARTFTDIETGDHAGTIMRPLDCIDVLSNSFLHRRPEFKSGVFAEPWPLLSASHQAQSRQLFSHICPSERSCGRNKGRQCRLVTPLQTSEDGVIKEQQRQRRRRRYKVECASKQKYLVPSLTEKQEDAKLCEWLQSLGITDTKEKDNITTNKQQRLFVSSYSREVMGHKEPDTAANHRRDRRPHFLPPIRQSDTLLHVPLLLPENSPPPSPCTYPNAPIHSVPVPLTLQPLTSRRK